MNKSISLLSALFCRSMLFKFLVIDASATALSADKISSKETIIGNSGASSTHLSIPSSNGVKDLRDAESIKLRKKSYLLCLFGIC